MKAKGTLDGSGWSTPRPGRFTPGNYTVPTVQEAGWAAGPVWMGAENLAPTGIRPPDCAACSESLSRSVVIAPYNGHCCLPEVAVTRTKAASERL